MRQLICACLLSSIPSAIWAQDDLPDMREACTPLYTVQKQACVVENVWRCDGDRDVLFVNETTFPDYVDVKFFTEEYEQVAPLTNKWKRRAAQKGAFALSDLLSEGKDTVFEGGELDILGDGYPLPIQIEGVLRLTGEEVTLSGEAFARAESKLVGRIGPLKYLKSGDVYLDSQTRSLFGGAFRHGVPPNLVDVDSHPVEILRAGDDGFMADAGVHGCEAS